MDHSISVLVLLSLMDGPPIALFSHYFSSVEEVNHPEKPLESDDTSERKPSLNGWYASTKL